MDEQITQNERYKQMTETPVSKLIVKLSVPTMVSMIITALYNIADTFFVSQIGTSASGAVGVVFSLMSIIQAIGFSLGFGSASNISRLLGKKQTDTANRMASTAFFTALICGLTLTILGLVFINPLITILGATDTIKPYAISYASYILIGASYMSGAFVLNNILRSTGSAFYAMIGIGSGAVINIILDPLFIFTFDMGISGAALATILSQLLSFCILLYNALFKSKLVSINFKYFTPKWFIYKDILKIGLPTFYRQGLASISTICLNVLTSPFGDAAIAAMSIVNKVVMFIVSALIGFGQGFQPVCGFNYGAGKYDRVLKAFWFCVKVAVIALSILGVIGFILAPTIMSVFRKGDLDVIRIGTMSLRLQCLTLPIHSWIILNSMLFQALGFGLKASIIAISRQGMCFIPLIAILPKFLGLTGIIISQPISNILTAIIATALGLGAIRDIKNKIS